MRGGTYIKKQINPIKDTNLNTIRRALREVKTATKPQLAELTGLSVVTVNSLVAALIEEGEILPDTVQSSEGGRPAASFRYHSDFRMALAIYMHECDGADTIYYRVVNLAGEVVEKSEQQEAAINQASFDETIAELLLKYPQIKAICFGIPGYETEEGLMVIDYETMGNQPLSHYVKEKFRLPVLVENDVNAATMGYCVRNKIGKKECVIGLYFPDKYPPGGGIYLDGKLYKGKNGMAGEIRYLPLSIDWENFDYEPAKMKEAIVKTILSVQCLYNPDKIVIYGKEISPQIKEEVSKQRTTQAEQLLCSEIIISEELNQDFEEGIKQSALNMIDTAVTRMD
ncbi:ROK family transcriptional regulator [Konateibacter massiliensis]|uniref:ROK family transcriptional regulator n=1 Tax=Konateibacter massiliensis TaxID=2002841 RepID=UPI000C153D52|nr:ROK family protein [Konateibacter massiliensis]